MKHFFFGLIKQLSSQSGPKGCFWNFLRLPNHDFAASSPINFAVCISDDSWYLCPTLSVGFRSKALTVLELWQFKVVKKKSLKYGFKKLRGLVFWANCAILCPLRVSFAFHFLNQFFWAFFCWKALNCYIFETVRALDLIPTLRAGPKTSVSNHLAVLLWRTTHSKIYGTTRIKIMIRQL